METRGQRWRNSLALRIPKHLAIAAELESNSPVEIVLRDKELIVTRLQKPGYTLDEILAQVTEANLHQKVETGPDGLPSPAAKRVRGDTQEVKKRRAGTWAFFIPRTNARSPSIKFQDTGGHQRRRRAYFVRRHRKWPAICTFLLSSYSTVPPDWKCQYTASKLKVPEARCGVSSFNCRPPVLLPCVT